MKTRAQTAIAINVLTAVFVALGLWSCMKTPDLTQNDGPTAAPQDVQAAIMNAWGNPDPTTIAPKEFSYVEKDLAIASFPPRVNFQQGTTVVSATASPGEINYKMLFQIAQISDSNQTQQSTSEDTICVDTDNTGACEAPPKAAALITDPIKQLSLGNIHVMDTQIPLAPTLVGSLLGVCLKGANWDVSCHNLSVTETVEAAPPQVAAQTNCAGLTNCQWKKKVVSFDLIVDSSDPASGASIHSKANYTLKISDDVPYLSRLTDLCYQGISSSNGQQVPVRMCQTIKNFIRGSNTP